MRLPLIMVVFALLLLILTDWLQRLDFVPTPSLQPARANERVLKAPAATQSAQPAQVEQAIVSPFRPRIVSIAKPEPWESVGLVGVVHHELGVLVLLRDEASGAVRRVQVGESIEGWRVQQVDRDCALLKRGPKQRRICVSGG